MAGQDILKDIWAHAPEIGIILGGAVATYVAKIKGFVTFGKPMDRRSCPQEVIGEVKKVCGDHKNFAEAIKLLSKSSEEQSEKIDKMDSKLDDICTDLSNIAGYLQGKNGYHRS